MIETLEVKKRDALGSWAVRKLRADGLVPAILYGHGEENVNLAVRREAVSLLVRHGARMLSLSGDVNETALLREVQWDTYGSEVLHLDFARVSQTERVEVTLPVHLHGEARGGADAQVLQVTHELTVECPAADIPDHIEVDISKLTADKPIHVSDLKLAEGMKAVTPGNIVIVHYADTSADTVASTDAPTEPELIGADKDEEGEDK